MLRPWPEKEIVKALGAASRIVVAERASQYGANNYLANEIGAALQRSGNLATIIQRVYGIGGLNYTRDDALKMYELAATWPHVSDPDERRVKWYHGAWPGDPSYADADDQTTCRGRPSTPAVTARLISVSSPTCPLAMHSAVRCGIFTTLNLFFPVPTGTFASFSTPVAAWS